MAEELKPPEELEVSVGNKKLRIRGNDVIGILQLIVICILAYGGYRHDADAAKGDTEIIQAIKANTQIQKEQLDAQREANCLNRLTPEQKKQEKEMEFCKALGKGR